MSPAELANSKIGKGIRVEVYSYHFKELHRLGVLVQGDRSPAENQSVTRYHLSAHLPQHLVDAAALKAIAGVLESVAEPLKTWIDKPFLDEIDQFVSAAGHRA